MIRSICWGRKPCLDPAPFKTKQLIPWVHASPGHGQIWCWVCPTRRTLWVFKIRPSSPGVMTRYRNVHKWQYHGLRTKLSLLAMATICTVDICLMLNVLLTDCGRVTQHAASGLDHNQFRHWPVQGKRQTMIWANDDLLSIAIRSNFGAFGIKIIRCKPRFSSSGPF